MLEDLRDAEADVTAGEEELVRYEAAAAYCRRRDPINPELAGLDEALDGVRTAVRALRTAIAKGNR